MSFSILNLLVGLFLAALIALVAYRFHALNSSGAAAAFVMGTVIFGLGGLAWSILLVIFFSTSSLLSKLKPEKKHSVNQNFDKSSRRDWAQVLANGGIATILVLFHAIWPQAGWIWFSYAAALAAANADTWSTELGVLSNQQPRMLTGFKKAVRGTSGAVTFHGTLAGLAGSALIAVFAVLFWQGRVSQEPLTSFFIISFSGLAGGLIDSFIGATIQATYFCPECLKETERHPTHSCGSETHLLRGLPWLNNDFVNLTCTISAALLAGLLGGFPV